MQHVALIVDTPNKNARIYPKKVIEACLPVLKEQIKEQRLFITAEEPHSYTVPLNDVVAEVKDVFLDGNRLVVDFEFLKVPLANAVQEELNRGNIALRSSGCGTVDWNPDLRAWMIEDNFEFTCFCFTRNPS